ncbi:putative WRKY transcription factor 19 [Phytophthora citrophthora]|uniref:WRKY transcription factor 19 n=1 Tax=Phytophthora citrophthora TaxID=4793 RepID=A0AAD9G3H5_9STRA|nr:putative WRKY transcription factor 19 [Phytophthora citrophthora]
MVPGNGSQLCTYAPTSPSDAKTISISIRRGSDGRASSIVLPQEHHLVRHLERLMTYDSPQSLQQPNYDVVTALSSVVKYIHTNNPRHEAPNSSIAALFSSLRPPSDHVRLTQRPAEQPMQRRSSKGRTRTTKHCKVLGCGNISVSRGLCRGHGGGRRCHYTGCSKSAQSRSVFCWSHGGGHRCEVENCMRSRKSKRFCADHVHLENQQAPRKAVDSLKMILNDADEEVPTQMPRNASLPSLQDALRNTQQTMTF